MKLCNIEDELVRCKHYIDVASKAVDNMAYYPEGGSIALLLDDVYGMLKKCIDDLGDFHGVIANE